MAFDVSQIESIVKELLSKQDLIEKFKADPVSAVKALSSDIPQDKIGDIVSLVKAKLAGDEAGDMLKNAGNILDKLSK